MNPTSQEFIVLQANQIIAEKFGISFSPENLHALEKLLLQTAKELGFHKNTGHLTELILKDQLSDRQSEVLVSNLTVGETFFFRDMRTLNAFRDYILKPLIESRRLSSKSLRIWSAACCSGEEPYTLAIMLKELIPDLKDWDLKVFASDLNPVFLEKAGKGIYTSWSFRNTRHEITEKYFFRQGNTLELLPEIRSMVTFFNLNLAADPPENISRFLDHLDVIFCRNVLMYFNKDQALKATQRLYSSLDPGGWLIISPVEITMGVFDAFTPVVINGITLFRKEGAHNEGNKRIFPVNFSPAISNTGPSDSLNLRNISRKQSAVKKIKEPNKDFISEYKKGNYLQSIDLIFRMSPSGPVNKADLELLVRSYANLGQLQQAKEWAEKLLRVYKTDLGAYYLYAVVLEGMDLHEEASEALRKALYLDPEHVLSHFLMGNICAGLGKKSKSRKHYMNIKELLGSYTVDEILPDSEGLTAGSMNEIINSLLQA